MSAETEADAAAIRQALDDIIRAAEAGSVDGYLSFITRDAVMMYAGAPAVIGKDNVKDFVAQFFTDYNWTFEDLQSEEVGVVGDLAFHRYSGISLSSPKAGGEVLREDRKYIDVMRKVDGSWKISHHIYNLNVP